jgi:ribosomal-protein-alanine acetyltransferase
VTSGDAADGVAVRRVEASDAEEIRKIAKSSPEAAQWDVGNYARGRSAGETILVAEWDGAVCGLVVFRVAGGECEILNLAVDPDQRRHGVGTSLLQSAVAQARRNKAKEVFLEVRESNAAAISFYAKQGFTKIGERARYYSTPTENAVLLKQKLTGQD